MYYILIAFERKERDRKKKENIGRLEYLSSDDDDGLIFSFVIKKELRRREKKKAKGFLYSTVVIRINLEIFDFFLLH